MKIAALLVFLILFSLPPRLSAVGVAGRFTTAAYTFQREIPDSLNLGDLRLFQTGSLVLKGIGSPELSLQTSIRTSLDVLHRSDNDPSTRLYTGFLRWSGSPLSFTAGRQFISSGVAVGTIDGLRLGLRFEDYLGLDFFAGTLAPLGRSRIFLGWDDGHMAGVHAVTRKAFGSTVGLSYYRRTRRVNPYWSRPGAGYPDSLFVDRVVLNGSYEVRPNAIDQEMAGLDVHRSLGRASIYGRIDVGLAGRVRIRRGEGEFRTRGDRGSASVSFLYRTPWTPASSVFSVFTQRSSREATGRGAYDLARWCGVDGELSLLSFEGRRGFRGGTGLSVLGCTLSYGLRRGYGGSSDGIGAELRKRLTELVWVSAGGRIEYFSYEEGTGPRSRVRSGTLGLNIRPVRHFTLSLEGQGLSQDLRSPTRLNPFPGLRNDFRFFFRASTWFFHGERLSEQGE